MNAPEVDINIVREHLNALAEHFDTVRILVSRCESGEIGGTITVNDGCGNVLASIEQAREWLMEIDERIRALAEDDFEETK